MSIGSGCRLDYCVHSNGACERVDVHRRVQLEHDFVLRGATFVFFLTGGLGRLGVIWLRGNQASLFRTVIAFFYFSTYDVAGYPYLEQISNNLDSSCDVLNHFLLF